jgi:hypothetical protein
VHRAFLMSTRCTPYQTLFTDSESYSINVVKAVQLPIKLTKRRNNRATTDIIVEAVWQINSNSGALSTCTSKQLFYLSRFICLLTLSTCSIKLYNEDVFLKSTVQLKGLPLPYSNLSSCV